MGVPITGRYGTLRLTLQTCEYLRQILVTIPDAEVFCLGNNGESRRLRKAADNERRWQAILRAILIGAYCLILVVAGLYLGYKGKESSSPVPATTPDDDQPTRTTTGAPGDQSSTDPSDTQSGVQPGAQPGTQSEAGDTLGAQPSASTGADEADNPGTRVGEPGAQAADSQGIGAQTADSQGIGAQAADAQGIGAQAADSQGTGTAGADTHGIDTQKTGAEPQATPAIAAETLAWPVSGEIASGPKWVFSELYGEWRYMPGVDIAAKPGDSVSAALTGTVVSVRNDSLLGTALILDHQDGLTTEYGRLSGCILGVGDRVKQGEVIARAAGATVYFGASRGGEAISVLDYGTK